MGVNGLLKFLGPISESCDITRFAGQRLAVDGYGWLHRAITTCAVELVTGSETTKFLEFLDRKLGLFAHHNVSLYFVFDGAELPLKARIEKSRGCSRALAREELARYGLPLVGADKLMSKAGASKQVYMSKKIRDTASKAVDVSPQLAGCVAALLKARGIPFVVAPYEADAQMVYLESNGIVDGILSEDSDLLVFGARTLITKLGPDGKCVLINANRLCEVPLLATIMKRGEFESDNNQKWQSVLRAIALLSGCDYSQGVEGIGVIKAAQLMAKYIFDHKVLEAVATRTLVGVVEDKIPKDFEHTLKLGSLAFQYHRVWDPVQRRITTLNSTQETIAAEWVDAIGPDLVPQHAFLIANCKLCPLSKQAIKIPGIVHTYVGQLPRRATSPTIASYFTPAKPEPNYLLTEKKVDRILGPIIQTQEVSPFFKSRLKSTPAPPPVTATPPPILEFGPEFKAKRDAKGETNTVDEKENLSILYDALKQEELPRPPTFKPLRQIDGTNNNIPLETTVLKRRRVSESPNRIDFAKFRYSPDPII